MSSELIVNERITAKQVKLIVDEKMIGVLSIRDAMFRARERGLDLIVVSDGEIPICRLLNADRYRYERAKAEREHARKQREMMVETKEVQLTPNIGPADLAIKARKSVEFLNNGDKVKLLMRLKGREKSHRNEIMTVIDSFLALIPDYRVEKPLSDAEKGMMMILGSTVSKGEKVEKSEKRKAQSEKEIV